MSEKTMESLPGFLGWFAELPIEAVCTLEASGVRLVAAFDHELMGDELAEASELLLRVSRDHDPSTR